MDKQVNLHPKNDSGTNLKPNIISENIPADSITYEKLNDALKDHYDKTILDDHSNFANQLRNADDAVADRIYTIIAADNTGYTNYPDGAIDGARDLLITLKSEWWDGEFMYAQYFINGSDVYSRFKDKGVPWSEWEKRYITYDRLNDALKDHYDKTILDDHSHFDMPLLNADDAVADRIYTIIAANNTGFTNYPDGAIDGARDLLITLKSEYYGEWIYVQYFINGSDVYSRFKNKGVPWSEWETRSYRRIFTVADGNANTLVNTIKEAVKINGSTVFIDGTYDLNSIGLNSDIMIGNDIKLIGSSRSLITYYYSGSDDNIRKNVSPFHKLYNGGGFTMENITIKCKNVRYCVHDEDSGANDIYHNYYRNCFFELDNTENPVWKVSQTIGGGLGTNGHIVIENSRFISHSDLARTIGDVSYHNSYQSYGKSHITVTGCYFENTFRAGWYGTSTEMTDVILTNNSFAVAPISQPENDEAHTENMQLITFNNTIRE